MSGLCLAIGVAVLLQAGDTPAPAPAVAPTPVELAAGSFRRSLDGYGRVKPNCATLLNCDAVPRAVTVSSVLNLPEARSQSEAKAIWVEGRQVGGKWQRVGGLRWDSAEVIWQWDGFFEGTMPEAMVAADRWLALLAIDVEAANGTHYQLARPTSLIELSLTRSRDTTIPLVPLPGDARLSLYRAGGWNEVKNDGLRMTLSAPDSPDLAITLDPVAQSMNLGFVGGLDQHVRELLRDLEQVKRLRKTAPADMAEAYRMQQAQLEEELETARIEAAAAAADALPEGPVLRVGDGQTGLVRFEVTVKFPKAEGS